MSQRCNRQRSLCSHPYRGHPLGSFLILLVDIWNIQSCQLIGFIQEEYVKFYTK